MARYRRGDITREDIGKSAYLSFEDGTLASAKDTQGYIVDVTEEYLSLSDIWPPKRRLFRRPRIETYRHEDIRVLCLDERIVWCHTHY